MESKNMNTGTLEVRYDDYLWEIRPDWFTIYSEYHGVIEMIKYQCETEYAYPQNMLPLKCGANDIWTENDECWYRFLRFNEWVNEEFQNLVAAYAWGEIEEYIEKFSELFKELNIDVKYTK